ncbi:MAG: Ig-like domain-containing protein, partial [Bacteroidia bacterium]
MGIRVQKWTYGGRVDLLVANGATSNNGTKATPCLSGDIVGDWREEVIFRADDNQSLRIYTTTTPTTYGFYTLLQDPHYRLAIAWQNVGYNQPPHPGFFLGNNMANPPIPTIDVLDPGTALNIMTPFDGLELGLGSDLEVIVHAVGLADTNQSVVLSLNGSPIDTISEAPYYVSLSGLTSGQYNLEASGYAPDGQIVQSSPRTFMVDQGFPQITLLSPTDGQAYLPTDSISLIADANDSNGSIDSVEFYIDDSLVANILSAPYQITLANSGLGLYTAKAIAYDNDGNATETSVVGFEVSIPSIIQENETGFCGFSNGTGTIDNDNAGFTGSGFANTQNVPGVQIDWAVDFGVGGTYRMEFRYASAENRPGQLILDDAQLLDTIPLANTGGWTTWDYS